MQTLSRVLELGADKVSRRLESYLRETRGDERPVAVVERLSGGWSVDTFRIRVGEEDLVLRTTGTNHPMGTSAAQEARLVQRAAAAGVRVPHVVVAENDPTWLGAPFAVVSYVDGIAPNVWSGRQMAGLLAAVTAEELLRQMVELALQIQQMSAVVFDEPLPSALGIPAREYSITADINRWLEWLEGTSRHRPTLALAGRWLVENAPPATGAVVQHHDFRLGNVLFDAQGRVAAVLDWEFAGAGDQLCDIGYAAQPYCLGRLLGREPSLDLSPDPTAWLLREYVERAPARVEPDRLRYFVALGIFKMAVALVLPADTWWRGEGGLRDAWLELPILSLTRDLIDAIRELP